MLSPASALVVVAAEQLSPFLESVSFCYNLGKNILKTTRFFYELRIATSPKEPDYLETDEQS
jgi:hypothetical protein